ncbi:hypothetical protein QTP70_015964 [Hemibagrus guttatus]|uniref:Uncharacterized protein n=1 Tax=Hemibagrus guttatus TaxID=175788 RepID=A0AAE0QE83_9TELE|nr:hypothetical protein QTP70_015964 [Hemibagrus guttatus]KAK3547127.1 hypothetical protein QTP86_015474 [Hemibagrus guttatus]
MNTVNIEVILRLIQLLMAYFDERTDGLILLADMSASAADVERTLNLPASPSLILLGVSLVLIQRKDQRPPMGKWYQRRQGKWSIRSQ